MEDKYCVSTVRSDGSSDERENTCQDQKDNFYPLTLATYVLRAGLGPA